MRVKIFGAGSIGNHLSQASRRMGWEVIVVDRDPAALDRMKNDIFPKRYGAWDPAIKQFVLGSEPKGDFDIIFIGTPPDTHMALAHEALKEKPRLMHIEKPLGTPDLKGIAEFKNALADMPGTIVTVGYDYSLGESIEAMGEIVKKKSIGEILTIDVEVREHWSGIFSAHSWLSGPEDTYLGYWRRGGGAGGEHSHALHLWQYFARLAGWGPVKNVQAKFDFRTAAKAEYDSIALFNLETESGNIGRVVQDVVTSPVKVWARVQGNKGFVEWHLKGAPEGDLVRFQTGDGAIEDKVFSKKRPDDFYREVSHYADLLSGRTHAADSPVALDRGIEVMELLNHSYPLR